MSSSPLFLQHTCIYNIQMRNASCANLAASSGTSCLGSKYYYELNVTVPMVCSPITSTST